MNVKTLLDRAQTHLADVATADIGADGRIWSRQELLEWLQDGYRQLVAQTKATKRFTVLEIPPRHGFAVMYPWEQRHTQGQTHRQFTYSSFDATRQTTTLWELESRDGLTAQAHATCITYLWELAHVSQDVDKHYRFALPKRHHDVLAVWHDHERLEALTTKELDKLDSAWYREQGEPLWYSPGAKSAGTFEVYEVETGYVQAYTLTGTYPRGIPRGFSGDRTYQFSGDDQPYGLVRRITSPDRQYITHDPWTDAYGAIRAWASSEKNLLVWETTTPHVPLLEDCQESIPDMIPNQLHKYLLYYVFSFAFNRQGEGYNPNLALHWEQRFMRAIPLLRRLADPTWRDVVWQREAQRRVRRRVLPQPQLPPEYPAVPWLR